MSKRIPQGRPATPASKRKVIFNLRFNPEILAKLRKDAAACYVSPATFLSWLIEQADVAKVAANYKPTKK